MIVDRYESDGDPVVQLESGEVWHLGVDRDSWFETSADILSQPSSNQWSGDWSWIGPTAQAQLDEWEAA